MRTNAQQELGKLKSEGNKVFNRTLAPKIDSALSEIEGLNKERERRMGLVFGPPEFQAGGYTGNVPWMGGWGLPRGAAGVVHPREFVSTEQATARFRPQLEDMNRGIAPSGGGGDNVTINAVDAASFVDLLNRHGWEAIKRMGRRDAQEGRR